MQKDAEKLIKDGLPHMLTLSDETAYAIVKYLNGYLFVLDVGAFKGNGYSDSVLTALANKAKAFKVHQVLLESNFGNGMFTKLFTPILSRIYPVAIEEVSNYKQKELRIIDTLEPILAQHKLIMNKSIITNDYQQNESSLNYSLFYQMTRISRDRGALAHDDRLDALTMAIEYFIAIMDRDVQKGIDDKLEESLMHWLDPDIGVFGAKYGKTQGRALYSFTKNTKIN